MSLRELASKGKSKKRCTHKGYTLTSKESKRIRRYGYRAERQLVKKLRSMGFKSVRIPVSAPSSEPLPDIFATKENCLLAFEIKASTAEKSYFRKAQVEKLFRFLNMFKAYEVKLAVLVGKFPYKWVFKRVEEVADYTIHKDERSNIDLETFKE